MHPHRLNRFGSFGRFKRFLIFREYQIFKTPRRFPMMMRRTTPVEPVEPVEPLEPSEPSEPIEPAPSFARNQGAARPKSKTAGICLRLLIYLMNPTSLLIRSISFSFLLLYSTFISSK